MASFHLEGEGIRMLLQSPQLNVPSTLPVAHDL